MLNTCDPGQGGLKRARTETSTPTSQYDVPLDTLEETIEFLQVARVPHDVPPSLVV
jgi:hypothetical protein